MTDLGWWSGTLREGWRVARLREVVTLVNGFPFNSRDFSADAGTPLIRIRDLLAGRTEMRVRGPVPRAVLVGDGALLIGMDGDFNAVDWRGGPAALNQRLCRVSAAAGLCQRYLRYIIPLPLRHINSLTYATTVKHLSSADLLATSILVPPPPVQTAIVAFLDSETRRVDDLIAAKRQMASLLLERRAVVTSAGVAGAFTSPERMRGSRALPWLESIPEGWRTAKLTLVARLGSGHTPNRENPEWWENCTIPWITTGEVAQLRDDRAEYITDTREMVSNLGVANSSAEVRPAGTVVLCRTASAGYSGIMATAMATSQDFVTWTCSPLLEPRYLLLCLRAMRSDLLGRLAQGSTHKTIYMPDIQSIRVPLPTIEEQRAIVDATWRRLEVIDDSVVCLDRQLELLAEHRQALVAAAVTGELDVPGAAA